MTDTAWILITVAIGALLILILINLLFHFLKKAEKNKSNENKNDNNSISDKKFLDISGHNGMQKLFFINTLNITKEKELEKINAHIADNWKVVKLKKSKYGAFVLIEYINRE